MATKQEPISLLPLCIYYYMMLVWVKQNKTVQLQ